MHIKKNSIRLLSALPFLMGIFFTPKEKQVAEDEEGWVGSISYNYKMFTDGEREVMEVKTEWYFYRKAQIIISVKGVNKKERKTDAENKEKNIGQAYMTDKLYKWQQQTSPYIKEMKAIQIITEKEKGEGEGEVNVWVEIDKERKTYWLKTDGPMYHVKRKARVWSNIIEMAGGQQPEDTSSRINEGIAIDVPDQPIGTNPKVLSGSHIVMDAGNIKVVVTWNLRKKCPPWNNPMTQTSINSLKPKVKAAAARFIQRVNDELCIRLKVTAGFRTIAEQDYEYSKGRTIPGVNVTPNNPLGETVTQLRGGRSNHNSGNAIDVYYATETGIDKHGILAPEIIEIARQEGFEWGGNWIDFKDYPHFEMKF